MEISSIRTPKYLLVLIGFWLLVVCLINPNHVGPLDDDWSYGWSVLELHKNGRFVLSDWTAANILPQVLWGLLITNLFGFTFDILRISSIIAALGGLLMTWALLRELGASRAIALAGMAVVGFNPIYLALALRFMSDIPSYGLWTASLWAFYRQLKRPNWFNLLLACGLGGLAILNRQSSVVVFAAYAVAELLRLKPQKANLIRSAITVVVGLIVYHGFSAWLATQQDIPALYGHQIKILVSILRNSSGHAIANVGRNIVHSSLFQLGAILLPFSLMLAPPMRWPSSFRFRATVGLLFTIVIVMAMAAIRSAGYLPGAGHIWQLLSIGPISFVMPLSSVAASRIIKISLTLFSLAGVLIWLPTLAMTLRGWGGPDHSERQPWRERTDPVGLFLMITGLLYALPILMLDTPMVFDRYLLPLLPLVMGALVRSMATASMPGIPVVAPRAGWGAPEWRQRLAIVLILLTAFYSTAINHDYMALYRARDQALDHLSSIVPPSLVDAGWESRGWYNGANDLSTCNPDFLDGSKPKKASWSDFTCLWTPPPNYRYKLSTDPEAGFDVFGRLPVHRWLPVSRYSLYILKRKI